MLLLAKFARTFATTSLAHLHLGHLGNEGEVLFALQSVLLLDD